MNIKTGLFFFLTLCCIITPISDVIDHICTEIKKYWEKIRTNSKNCKLTVRTIYHKNHENFKNSKYWVSLYRLCYKKSVSLHSLIGLHHIPVLNNDKSSNFKQRKNDVITTKNFGEIHQRRSQTPGKNLT